MTLAKNKNMYRAVAKRFIRSKQYYININKKFISKKISTQSKQYPLITNKNKLT